MKIKFKKQFIYLLIIPLLIFALLVIQGISSSSISMFPSDKDNYRYSFYTDSASGGNSSIIDFNMGDRDITFKYLLRKGYRFPFAGFKIVPAENNEFMDFSSFEKVKFIIKVNQPQNTQIILATYEKGITNIEDDQTFRYNSYEVTLQPDQTKYELGLIQFTTPNWWFRQIKKGRPEVGEIDFSRILEIGFENGHLSNLNMEYGFKLSSIIFYKSRKGYYIQLATFFSCYYLILFITFFLMQRKSKVQFIPYKSIPQSTNDDNIDVDAKCIITFIGKHYDDPDLNISKVSKETGVPGSKISLTLKEIYNYNFKQYLNSLRIAEAKRLLLETDENITRIALDVGYNNPTHFHRIFKKAEDVSPREFRLKNE